MFCVLCLCVCCFFVVCCSLSGLLMFLSFCLCFVHCCDVLLRVVHFCVCFGFCCLWGGTLNRQVTLP